MKGLVKEWIEKAEADANTARREVQVVEDPNWDAVCFHVQQAIEKYLKGLLLKDDLAPSRTHDLAVLLNPLLNRYPDLKKLHDDMEWISAFAVEIRYPGETADKADAKKAVAIMERAIKAFLNKFPLP
jgi:HEPN domain-containing protein